MNLKRIITSATAAAAIVLSASATAQATAPDLPPQTQAEVNNVLKYPAIAAPGAKIVNLEKEESCTVGWAARDITTNSQGFITAGHCGKAGDPIALPMSDGDYRVIGEVLWSAYNSTLGNMEDTDIAFVKVNSSSDVSAQMLSMPKTPSSLMSVGTFKTVRPDLCKIGQVTGTTCGNAGELQPYENRVLFYAPSYEGDSGSPVFARTRSGEVEIVGVLSGNTGLEEDHISVQPLTDDIQRRYEFELVTQ